MALNRPLIAGLRSRPTSVHVSATPYIIFVFVCTVGAIVADGRMKLMLLSLDAIGICGLILLIMSEIAPEFLLPRVLTVCYAVQCFLLFWVGWLDLENRSHLLLVPDLTPNPYRAVLPQLIPPLAALAVIVTWSLFTGSVRRQSFWQRSSEPPAGFEAFLIAGALLSVLYWLAAREDASDPFSYVVRILQHGIALMPLLAGRYRHRFRIANLLWIAVLVINSGIGMVLGSRSAALVPLILYLIGFVLATPPGRRMRLALMILIAAVPVSMIAGAVGIVRVVVGRGDIGLLNMQRVTEVADLAWQEISFTSNSQSAREGIAVNGIGRMVAWPTLAVTTQTPEFIPYRGFDGFVEEVAQSLQIYAVRNISRADINNLELFNYPATRYGYTVDLGTSVEWGVIADAWSRGGIWATFAFSFVLVFLSVGAEHLLLTRIPYSSTALMVFCLLISAQMLYGASPALYIIRQTFLDGALVVTICLVVERFRPRSGMMLRSRTATGR